MKGISKTSKMIKKKNRSMHNNSRIVPQFPINLVYLNATEETDEFIKPSHLRILDFMFPINSIDSNPYMDSQYILNNLNIIKRGTMIEYTMKTKTFILIVEEKNPSKQSKTEKQNFEKFMEGLKNSGHKDCEELVKHLWKYIRYIGNLFFWFSGGFSIFGM